MEKHSLDALLFLGNVGGSDLAARAGYPVITVPAGYAETGIVTPGGYTTKGPQGVTFVGTAFSEPTLIKIAHGFASRPASIIITKDQVLSHMIMNEKIKASEVLLTGLDGEDLGVVPTSEALAMARELKVDLICASLMSSPPSCKLMGRGAAKEQKQQDRKRETAPKLKEIRLTARIEDHDYETKKAQVERILSSGDAAMLVVKIQGKEGAQAKALLESLIKDLRSAGRPKTGIQLSGKQAAVQLDPIS